MPSRRGEDFYNMTNMATLLHKKPCPMGHEIDNFDWSFVVHDYYTHSSYLISYRKKKSILQ